MSEESTVETHTEAHFEQEIHTEAQSEQEPELVRVTIFGENGSYAVSDGKSEETLRAYEATLASLSSEDPDRPIYLNHVAAAMVEYHRSHQVKGEGGLPKALDLLHEALNAVGPDDPNCGEIYSSFLAVCFRLYKVSGSGQYLSDAIKYGLRAVAFTHRQVYYGERLSLHCRCRELVSATYLAKFEDPALGGCWTDLEQAFVQVGRAADDTGLCKSGFRRFDKFCLLGLMLTDVSNDTKYLEGIIRLRKNQSIDLDDPDVDGPQNLRRLVHLLARKYERTRSEDDLKELIAVGRTMLAGEDDYNDDEAIAGIADIVYRLSHEYRRARLSDDPLGPYDTRVNCSISVIAELMSDHEKLPASLSAHRLGELNTNILLFQMALQKMKENREDARAFRKRQDIINNLATLLDQKWKVTNEVSDAEAADEMNILSAQGDAVLQAFDNGVAWENIVSGDTLMATVLTSRVTGEQRTVNGPLNSIFGSAQRTQEGPEETVSEITSTAHDDELTRNSQAGDEA